MATFLAGANGNITDAATWRTVATASASFLYSVAGATTLTGSYQESSALTPGAIDVDGIVVYVQVRAASPSGTISVRLADGGVTVAGTEVTINVSDIDRPGAPNTHFPGLYFFKFAAPVTLVGATPYTVSAKTSAASQVDLGTDGTVANWTRMLRTTTTGAPGAGDDMHILGEYTAAATKTDRTVTMNQTATTDYGSGATDLNLQGFTIGKGGILTWGVVFATNYVLQLSTGMRIWRGGVMNMGTVSSPVPSGSTATLQFDCGSDGAFGLSVEGTINAIGSSRTALKPVVQCLLNTNEAAGQTTLGVSADTGWKSGDEVWIASTSLTATESEKRTLNADAGASSIVVTAGLTNAHSGTSPTQAEVILITRNVVIKSVSTSNMSFVVMRNSAVADFDWVRFTNLGVGSDFKQGVQIRTVEGSCTLDFCGIDNFENYGLVLGAATLATYANIAIRNCTIASAVSATIEVGFYLTDTTGTNITIDGVTVTAIHGTGGGQAGFFFEHAPFAVSSNLRAAGCNGTGIFIESSNGDAGAMSNLHSHSNGVQGISLQGSGTIKLINVEVWHNNAGNAQGGIALEGFGAREITGGQVFGNAGVTSTNIRVAGAGARAWLRNLTIAGSTTHNTSAGLGLDGGAEVGHFTVEGCSFGVATGIFTAHTFADIGFGGLRTTELLLINTVLASATEIAGVTATFGRAVIRQQRADGVTSVHRTQYLGRGSIEFDPAVFHSASPSEKISPTGATAVNKIKSAPRLKPIASGATAGVQVWVRKDSPYTGSAPRLMMKSNAAIGVTADTLLATHSGVSDVWELLTGTTPVAAENGACEFFVDGDGSAGSFWTDDWR